MNAPVKHKRDSVATRARIEKEALRLFAEKGVDGATIRDLSLAVGVADAALYRAKAEGRGIFRFFEAGMDQRLRERRALQQELQ